MIIQIYTERRFIMTEQLILTFVITLVAGTTGLYIRDGQNSKKSEDKKLNFVFALIFFILTMVVLNTVFVLK
tara:strand:- start:16746 stop:16961 length:216 start_codon:yes stop_codon:yes gene_type:complete